MSDENLKSRGVATSKGAGGSKTARQRQHSPDSIQDIVGRNTRVLRAGAEAQNRGLSTKDAMAIAYREERKPRNERVNATGHVYKATKGGGSSVADSTYGRPPNFTPR